MMTELTTRLKSLNAIPGLLLLFVGLFLGWLFFAGSGSGEAKNDHVHSGDEATTIWTCSMHPNVRQPSPGLCPICAMDLIPLDADASADDVTLLRMTPEAIAAANIHTTAVRRGMPYREIRLSGRIEVDETRNVEITARVSGRIEQLYVSTTGQRLRKGAKLASMYSPDLLATQKELLEAAKMKSTNPAYYEAARNKLQYWDFTDGQIDAMERNGSASGSMDILAPQGGTVLARHVSTGNYVRQGQPMFAIADLGRVWVQFDAYENDLAWLRPGMSVHFTVAGQHGTTHRGSIAFIDPVIDPMSRVARARVEMPNPSGALKPEMFANGVVKSMLPGRLEALLVPKSAVLWTGKRAVVWVRDVESEAPAFRFREIVLGEQAGDVYVVREGLVEGEEVVSHGVFSVDAAAQLQGKTSMMNPSGGRISTGHDHAGVVHSGSTQEGRATREAPMQAPKAFRKQLRAVFDAYEQITARLVASDPAAIPAAVQSFRKSLGDVELSALQESARIRWAEAEQLLRKSIDGMASTRDTEKQRAHYSGLGNTLYELIKQFGVEGGTLYWQHCPMAFDDAGANWLSSEKEIRNPYFGDRMLKCGVVQEEIR